MAIEAREDRTAESKDVEVIAEEAVTVIREGKQIIIPKGMTYDRAIEWMKDRRDEDEQLVDIERTYSFFPPEGAIALMKVLRERYGFVKAKSIPPASFFESVQKPQLIDIEVGVGRVEQIPFGRFAIPGITGWLQSGLSMQGGIPVFTLTAEVQKAYEKEVTEILNEVGEVALRETPYRGQAIRLPYYKRTSDADVLSDFFPKFIDVRSANIDQMVFAKDVEDLLMDNVFGPVINAEEFRNQGIPLKMGVLLEGEYGCGKTLIANVLAKTCTENGWTYILCEDPADLSRCVRVARRFEPCVVFCEDIDREVSGEKRTKRIDAILNTIDGIEAKGTEIMVVLTTNHVDQLAPAMRRPGRLDVVVPVGPPDAEAATRMIALYAGGRLKMGADLTEVGELLSGKTPAVLREVVERAKRTSIVMAALRDEGKPDQIDGEALTRAAKGMKRHLDLLEGKPDDVQHPVDNLAEAIREHSAE